MKISILGHVTYQSVANFVYFQKVEELYAKIQTQTPPIVTNFPLPFSLPPSPRPNQKSSWDGRLIDRDFQPKVYGSTAFYFFIFSFRIRNFIIGIWYSVCMVLPRVLPVKNIN